MDAVFSDQQNDISPFLMICHYSIPKLEEIGIDTTLAITDMEWIWNDIELSSVFCQKDTPLSNPDIIFSSSLSRQWKVRFVFIDDITKLFLLFRFI